jgi:hypothetical protein
MSVAERPSFGASEVIQIASKFEADDDAFVIGGQATNFWAWFFRDKEPALRLKEPFTSEDIDYFGSQDVAKNVAAALGGKLFLPERDDHTPNTAQIVTTFHGKRLVIDFLGSVLGVKERELRRGVSILEVTADVDGIPTVVLIKVLHPVLCLKSRIINMLHPATRRGDRIARTQAEAALLIVRRFIHDALDDPADWREERDCFATLYWYLRSDEYVKAADLKLGLDVLDILRAFADDMRIDPRYRERQLKKMIANIERRRARRRDAGQ